MTIGATDAMSLWQLIVLAVVQGVTEFLPISSSAHLILVPVLTGWADQGLGIDVAMHVGTLGALMLYFRRDLLRLVSGAGDLVRGRDTEARHLSLQILVATCPVVVAGFVPAGPNCRGLAKPCTDSNDDSAIWDCALAGRSARRPSRRRGLPNVLLECLVDRLGPGARACARGESIGDHDHRRVTVGAGTD